MASSHVDMGAFKGSIVTADALARREALVGASGPMALVRNARVFGITCFACLGG